MLDTHDQGTWTPDGGKELDAMVYSLQHDHAYECSSVDSDYFKDKTPPFILSQSQS